MHPSEIARSYDSIANLWLNPQRDTNGIEQHEHALRFRQCGGHALDVGCGCNSRFICLLARHGYTIEGLDISTSMIALAREHSPGVTFHHADVCEWTPRRQYDFITAWDSIWHVPLQMNEIVLRKLCGALAPNGIIIWTTGGLDGPEEKEDCTMGPPMYYSVLGIPKTLQIVAESGCVCRHLEFDQLPENHVFLVAQKA